ncbi:MULTISPECIES: hypothetical protein [unclassified Campylobacter]|uniref:hypothetical protein n=1 Tax=unclassified Campylobacter TaxID=2593542 RepID=UPI000A350DBC|nr:MULTISPECIES: hypothetical protein [unclassified Campylobacter]
MGISKSLYINDMQCPKLLWLSKHRKGDESVFAPNASLEAVFERGNEVGELACELFKGGERIEWEGTSFDEKIAKKRKELLAYCGLDTLAMVKVLEGLKELVK